MTGPRMINDIMTKEVVTVDIKQKVQEALDIMQSRGLRKIIVTVNGLPKYILEDWNAWRLPKKGPLEEFERSLRIVEKVQSGTNLEEARRQLEQEPAIIIIQDNQMIGIATATDLTKLMDLRRQKMK